ncbi:MAG: hypothetical protein KAQ99_02185, partial [Candidatus Aureabacteria bacterium]|nr:hypothetical protein [Candidatus Auribacterota bacterium]
YLKVFELPITGADHISSVSLRSRDGIGLIWFDDLSIKALSAEEIYNSITPFTYITNGPEEGESVDDEVTFVLSGEDIDGSIQGYVYSLDKPLNDYEWFMFIPEEDETTVTFKDLDTGEHTFYVAAVDNAGFYDPNPIARTFNMNKAPEVPFSPWPADGAVNVPKNINLSWIGGDPDPEDTVTYSVYLGTSENPLLISENQSDAVLYSGILEDDTTYYWRVVSKDNQAAMAVSPVWSFTTWNVVNNPPVIESAVSDISISYTPVTVVDLTPHEDDVEDGPAGEGNSLVWSITGVDLSLCDASIDAVTDNLTVTSKPGAGGAGLAVLTLKDLGGLEDTQDIVIYDIIWGEENDDASDVFDGEWGQHTINAYLLKAPFLSDDIVITFKAKITVPGASYDYDYFGIYVSVNGTGGYRDDFGTWDYTTVQGEGFDWYTLSLPADIDGDGVVDWIQGINELTIGTSSSESADFGKTGVDIFIFVSNNPPVITSVIPDITIDEDTSETLDLTGYESDSEDGLGADGNSLTWSVSGAEETLFTASIDPATDALTVTSVLDASGSDVITLALTDSVGLIMTQDITVTITEVPDDPEIEPAVSDITIVEDTAVVTIDLSGNEKDAEDGSGDDNGLEWSITGVDETLFMALIDPATD